MSLYDRKDKIRGFGVSWAVIVGLHCLTLILKLAINSSVSVSYIRRYRTRKNSVSHPESALLEQLSCLKRF